MISADIWKITHPTSKIGVKNPQSWFILVNSEKKLHHMYVNQVDLQYFAGNKQNFLNIMAETMWNLKKTHFRSYD